MMHFVAIKFKVQFNVDSICTCMEVKGNKDGDATLAVLICATPA